MVIGVDSEKLIVGECNWYKKCEISWDRWIYKSNISIDYIYSAPYAIITDTEAPSITEGFVDIPTMTSSKYKVKIKASDNVGVTSVRFAAWTAPNGQDEIVWKDGTYNSTTGYWETYVYKSEHNNETENYATYAFAYDAAGNEVKYKLETIPMGSTVNKNLGDFTARIVGESNTSYAIGINGTNVELETKSQSDSTQLWKFIKNSDNTYSIVNVSTGKYLDVVDMKDEDYTNIQIHSKNGSEAQKFYIMNYNGGYRIVASYSDNLKAVDLADAYYTSGRNIRLHHTDSSTNVAQTWSFEKVAESISLSSSTMTIGCVGESKKLTATISPSTVSNKTVTWSSSNTSVAKVSSTGVVTAVGKGTATITAKTTDGTNKTAKCTVTVKLPFIDMGSGDWYYTAVEYCYRNNYILGTTNTTFEPNVKVTRAMLVTILHRMEGSPYVSGTSKFPDVQDTSAYYYVSVKWATQNGIVSGYNNGKFGPNDPITREQLAVILNNYCKYKGKYKATTADFSIYKDSNKISEFAKWGMNWAVGSEVITGSNGYLNPQGTATRAEVASMIYKYCLNIK